MRGWFIVDSGATLHITNDTQKLYNMRPACDDDEVTCGGGTARIVAFGESDLIVTNEEGRQKRKIRLKDVAYIPNFPLNIASQDILEEEGYRFLHWKNQICKAGKQDELIPLGHTRKVDRLHYIKGDKAIIQPPTQNLAFHARKAESENRKKRAKGISSAEATLWHRRLGHVGPAVMEVMTESCLGARIRGPTTAECADCALSKIKQRPTRIPVAVKAMRPFHTISIDFTELDRGWDGFQGDGIVVRRVMFVSCEATGLVVAYFMTSQRETETLKAIKDALEWIRSRYELKVKVIRSDNEIFRPNATKAWLRSCGVEGRPAAPHTQDQNGSAELTDFIITKKARSMRLGAKLPHDRWRDIFDAAVYLHNRTPQEKLGWMSPYEVFHIKIFEKEEVSGPVKPVIRHLRAYGCKCYYLYKNEKAEEYPKKRMKLEPRGGFGYLVGYQSTSIYRVWVPAKNKVILIRDVILDETEFYEPPKEPPTAESIAELDEYLIHHQLSYPEHRIEHFLEHDENLPEQESQQELTGEDIIMQDTVDQPITPEEHEDFVDNLIINHSETQEEENLDGCSWEPYPTPPTTPPFAGFVTNEQISMPFHPSTTTAICLCCTAEGVPGLQAPSAEGVDDAQIADDEHMIEPAILAEIQRQRVERFFDFRQHRISRPWQLAFHAGATGKRPSRGERLPPPPEHYSKLETHPLREQFHQAMRDHLREHTTKFKSWSTVDRSEAKGHQILGCHWVFTYKKDKHGRVIKCKARLVVCGNQQSKCDLPTRATTLAAASFRTLLAIIAKFDLETLQMDAVNAFVNAELPSNETVFMRMPPGVPAMRHQVCRLNKALYGLRRSPLLWQTTFTNALRDIGFKELPQEPCVATKDGVICFFFVDDIVFAYRKEKEQVAKDAAERLQQRFEMKIMDDFKWFLGMRIDRDRQNRKLFLSQASYIQKIAEQFGLTDINTTKADTPMTEHELLPAPDDEIITPESNHLYQSKIGSLLFAAISTRPDIAFAASRLSRFNQRAGKLHHDAADRAIRYLYTTRYHCLVYGGEDDLRSFVCASDASFADNTLDRKSSQGYIFTLFGGPVAWRANKQDTVTTSSTEAELLALSQAAKEAIYMARLFKALSLELNEPLSIQCDNRQTLRLLLEESLKLQTKLRHVDIHSHWLRQEVQRRAIHLEWRESKKMMADGLTKALGYQNFVKFRSMIGLMNEEQRLLLAKRQDDENDLKQRLQTDGLGKTLMVSFAYNRDFTSAET